MFETGDFVMRLGVRRPRPRSSLAWRDDVLLGGAASGTLACGISASVSMTARHFARRAPHLRLPRLHCAETAFISCTNHSSKIPRALLQGGHFVVAAFWMARSDSTSPAAPRHCASSAAPRRDRRRGVFLAIARGRHRCDPRRSLEVEHKTQGMGSRAPE